MKRISCVLVLFGTSTLFGCQPDAPKDQARSSEANTTGTVRSLDDQAYLVQLVRESEIANNERSLVHVSHTCTLQINGEAFAVVDMRELVKGATTARGINQILLLNSGSQ